MRNPAFITLHRLYQNENCYLYIIVIQFHTRQKRFLQVYKNPCATVKDLY